MEGYDFDSDPRWKDYVQRAEFSTPEALNRAKRRWFEKNVTPSSSSSSSSSSSRTHSTSSSYNSRHDNNSGRARGSFGTLSYVWLGFNVLSLVFGVMYAFSLVFTMFKEDWGLPPFFFYSMMCQLVIWGFNLYVQVGPVQFNQQYLMRAFQNDASHYLLYCILFVFMTPTLYVLMPLLIYSVFNAGPVLVAMSPSLGRFWGRVSPFHHKAFSFAIQIEVMLLPILVFYLFTGNASFIAILGHYKFLTFRYITSAASQAIISQYVAKLDGFMMRTPVNGMYLRIRNYLALDTPQVQ